MKNYSRFRYLVPALFIIAVLLSLTNNSFAQKAPADSTELLNDPAIKMRLKKLLGMKNYDSFLESFETETPVVKSGAILFSSGCLIHACGHVESAIAVNLVNKTIHAAIFRQGERTKYFNEKKRATPKVIRSWANRLTALNQ